MRNDPVRDAAYYQGLARERGAQYLLDVAVDDVTKLRAARSAAESAARSAAADVLRPVVAALEVRAVALLRRMAAVGRAREEAPRG